jgi:hypothetical protein
MQVQKIHILLYTGTVFFVPVFRYNLQAVLRIWIRDPVLFYPKDPDPGSGMIFFRILDPGSLVPTTS